ncbi:MAG: fibrobacter succinogenes major paralogous domain-containing protein [Bacteroidales bacterium]
MNYIFIIRSFAIIMISVLLTACEKEKKGLPIDGDGNIYDTVVIGTQVWLTENLKTTKYNNGDPIPLITDNPAWSGFNRGAYCWYDNDIKNKDVYGALYNSYAAKLSNFLCPIGWHIPTASEWSEMITNLGGSFYAGGKLKEAGTVHWISESQGTTNETGFTALPGGCRYLDGTFRDIREHGYWWMSDLNRYVTLHYSNNMSGEGSWNGIAGYSVRCIKDK